MSIYKDEIKKRRINNSTVPVCCVCEDCYTDRSKKHDGITHYCKITGNDVHASHFGLSNPKNCPKRG